MIIEIVGTIGGVVTYGYVGYRLVVPRMIARAVEHDVKWAPPSYNGDKIRLRPAREIDAALIEKTKIECARWWPLETVVWLPWLMTFGVKGAVSATHRRGSSRIIRKLPETSHESHLAREKLQARIRELERENGMTLHD